MYIRIIIVILNLRVIAMGSNTVVMWFDGGGGTRAIHGGPMMMILLFAPRRREGAGAFVAPFREPTADQRTTKLLAAIDAIVVAVATAPLWMTSRAATIEVLLVMLVVVVR